MRKICTLICTVSVVCAALVQATKGHTVGYQAAVGHVSDNSVPMIFYRDLFMKIKEMPKTSITVTFVNGRWRTIGDDNSTVEYNIRNPTKAEVEFQVERGRLSDVVFTFNNPITIIASGAERDETRLEYSAGQDTGIGPELTPNLSQAVGRHLNISSDPLRLFQGIPFVFSTTSLYLGVSGTQPGQRRSMISAVEYRKSEAFPNNPGTKIVYNDTTFHFSPQITGPGNTTFFSSYAQAKEGSSAVLTETTFKLDVDSCRDSDQNDACDYRATFVGGKLEVLNLAVDGGRLTGDGIVLRLGDNSTLTFKNPDPPGNFEPRVIFNSNDSLGLLTADRGFYNGTVLQGTRLPFKDGSVFNVTDQFRGADPSFANLEALHLIAAGEKLTELSFGGSATSLKLGLGENSKVEAGQAGKIQVRRGSVIADIGAGRWTFAGSEDVKQSRLKELELELSGGDLNISNGSHVNIISGSTISATQLRVDTDFEPNITGAFGKSTLRVKSDQPDRPIQFSEALQVYPSAQAEVTFDETSTPMKLEVNRRFLTGSYQFAADLAKLVLRQESNPGAAGRKIKFSIEQGTAAFNFTSIGSTDAIEAQRLVITNGMVKEAAFPLGQAGDLAAGDGSASFELSGTLKAGTSSALTGAITWNNVSSVRGKLPLNRETIVAFGQGRFDRADLTLTNNAAVPITGSFRNVQLSLADLSTISLPGLIRIKSTSGNTLTANVADDPLTITAELPYVKGTYTTRLGFSEISAVNSAALIQGGQNQGNAVLTLTSRANGDIAGSSITIQGIRSLRTSNGATIPLVITMLNGEAAIPASAPATLSSDLEIRTEASRIGEISLGDHRPIPQSNPKGWFFPAMLDISIVDFKYAGRMQLSSSGVTVAGANAALKLSFSSPPASPQNNLKYGEYKDPKKLSEGVRDNSFRGMMELWRNKTKISSQFDCRQRVHLDKNTPFVFDTRPLVGINNDAVTLLFNEKSVDIPAAPPIVLFNCPDNPNPTVVQNVPAVLFSGALSGHRFFPALSSSLGATSPLRQLVWAYESMFVVAALNTSDQKITFRFVP